MKTILLIAGLSERYYYEKFVDACKFASLRVLVLDPDTYPQECSLAIVMESNGLTSGVIDVWELHSGGHSRVQVNIGEVDVAWYLRENSVNESSKELTMEARFARNESDTALLSVESLLECVWVNKRTAIRAVQSNKLYQQQRAAMCGLRVPTTVLSNDVATVQDAATELEGLLLKSIGYVELDPLDQYALYSERFSVFELLNSADAIKACPVFAQEYVEKDVELRVMVIGEHILACSIDSQASERTRVDWRHYDFEHVRHVQVTLPEEVQNQLFCFMRAVDLRYGAIDLIKTPDGEYVFLEVNPSGQWGWIADLAQLPIVDRIVDMLQEA